MREPRVLTPGVQERQPDLFSLFSDEAINRRRVAALTVAQTPACMCGYDVRTRRMRSAAVSCGDLTREDAGFASSCWPDGKAHPRARERRSGRRFCGEPTLNLKY